MSAKAFVKSDFLELELEQILTSVPGVLLGVTPEMGDVLAKVDIQTVFDLGMSPLFSHAARLVNESADVSSVYRKFGRAPAGYIDDAQLPDQVAALPWEQVAALIGVGVHIGPDLDAGLSATVTIRDLALWPPYLAAKAIIVEAYNPDLPEPPDEHRELVPIAGEFGTERHLYSSVVMFPGEYTESKSLHETLFDISAAALTGFTKMRFGALLTFSQTWFPRFVAKGQLLHSLPLAPGESTNVAVIDWTNKSKAATQQEISESEKLYSTNDRTRTISQIATGVANDFESGASTTAAQSGSFNTGTSAFLGIGVGNASVAVNEATSSTHVVSTGSRAIASTLQQNIVDSTQQNSSDVRSQRAAVVSEVSQSDTRNFSTRNITNYNHMHALTFQYYEVVQIYETQVRRENAERCIFIPLKLFDFTDERVIAKYLPILKRVALNYTTRSLLQQLGSGYTATWGFRRDDSQHPQLTGVPAAYGTLQSAGFIRGTAVEGSLSLHSELQLNNVVVETSRTNAPKSLVATIMIDMEDGSTLPITASAKNSRNPAAINSAIGSEPLSFGSIRAIRIQTVGYTPQNAAERLTKVKLAVRLRGESRFLDASFVIQDGMAYDGTTLLQIDPPTGIEALQSQLMEHQLYYSQRIWMLQNPQSLIMQFAGIRFDVAGKKINLIDYITPVPLQVVGNYLVYRFTYEDDQPWRDWLTKHFDRAAVTADMVAVPTGGVFGEAVLGRFNAGEKLDLTRFANWDDSPPPNAPTPIAPVSFTEPQAPAVPPQATFSTPLVNIQNPINLPAPTGLSDVLASIVKGGSFPDVSGLPQTGDAAVKATEAASANSLAALKASGEVLGAVMSSIGKLVQASNSSAIKTTSAVGAAINKEVEQQKEAQKKAEEAAKKAKEEEAAGKKDPAKPAPEAKPDAAKLALEQAIGGSPLAALATGLTSTSETATDATALDGVETVHGDQALLSSALITEPLFTDVLGFLVLLQLIPDDKLLDVLQKRFSTLDKKVDEKTKYTETLAVFNTNSADLMNADRILFALRFQKASVLPEDQTLDGAQIKRVKAAAAEKMVDRAFPIASRVNADADVRDVLRNIVLIASEAGVHDINQIAYMLATAYHESAMGRYMSELANGVSTDTVFTKDQYFFDAIPGKKSSYNGINGNLRAGNQLSASGDITTPADIAAWNGITYPVAQPDAVKLAARECDFYRFIGRGLVQITGRDNYSRYSNLAAFANADFLTDPELVSDIPVAARILVTGMVNGEFRGAHKLSDYVTATGYDGVNARDIVNGDKNTNGRRIRDIAKEFRTSLIINTALDEAAKLR